MPRKPKQQTAFDLIKKEQLRAKELTLSEEYRKDITRHQELEEELSRWTIEEGAFRNPTLTPHPIIDSPEVRAHIQKGRKLRSEIISSYDNILNKYSISRPVSLDLLKQIAEGLEQKGLRHRDEIPVKMLLPDGTCRKIEHDGYQVDLNSRECFSIEINPRGSKTDILHYVSKLLDACAEHGIKIDTRFRDERLKALEVYRLRSLKYGYIKISSAIGIMPDAARKAFAKAYELIHGTPYRKGIKLKTSKALLKKDCITCTNKICIKNMKPCPEMDAYADQDRVTNNQYYQLIRRITVKSERPDIPSKGKGKATAT